MKDYRPLLFILRRCYWKGKTSRQEVMEAFEMPMASASRALVEACEKWPGVLIREKRHVMVAPHAVAPLEANSQTMLHLLEMLPESFADTGLRPEELRVVGTMIRKPSPMSKEMTELLLKTIIQEKALDILYVGLKYGDKARWRSVVPLSLDPFQGQWRVRAHDLEVEDFPVKTFVLSRILDARISLKDRPKKLILEQGELSQRRFQITLNSRLTKDQKVVVAREIGLDEKGVILLNENEEFYFRRTYVDVELKTSDQTVWPLVTKMNLI